MSTPGDRRAQFLRVWGLSAVGVGLAAWFLAVILMAGRGLDTTDEGFYLLSYHWWHSTPRIFTGVQYIYGPVLDALGGSVAGLRMFRFLTVIGLHATLGWSVIGWLRVRTAGRLLTPTGELVVAGAITASGAIVYGWLPLSPGYNDIAVLASVGLAAALLRSMRAVRIGRALPVLPAVASALAAVLLVVAKWSSGVLVLVVAGSLGLLALRRLRATGWLRFLVATIVSSAVFGVGFVLLAGGGSVFSSLVTVNKLVAGSTNSPTELIRMYLSTGFSMVGEALALAAPGVVCVVVARAFALRGAHRPASTFLVLAPVSVMVCAWPGRFGIPLGGSSNIEGYTAPLVALTGLIIGGVALGVRSRTAASAQPAPDGYALVLLLAMPLVQALGTGNPLYDVAVNGFGCWVAALVVLVSGLEGAPAVVGRAGVAVAVAVCVGVGVSGLLEVPYRTASFAESRTTLGGQGITAGLRLGQSEALMLEQVRAAAGDPESGTPVMAFDELAGYVLALDGRSVGEAWYSATDHHRTHVGIEAACTGPNPFGGRRPVVLFARAPEDGDREALRACHVDLGVGYQLVRVPFAPGRSMLVYRPSGARE